MFKYQLFGVLFLLCLTLETNAQLTTKIEKFPSYETVVNTFYDSYNIKDENKMIYISFARTPKGWKVILTDYFTVSKKSEHTTITKKEYTFWMRNGFRKIKTFKSMKNWYTDSSIRQKQLSPYNIRMFDIHTFYGYQGWADDVIKYLSPKIDRLNDDDLYSLGRAYSAVSGTLVGLNKDASLLPIFNTSKPKNNLNEKQIVLYLKYQKASQDCYFKLYQRNPNFDVIVGKIQTKYANEVVQNYFDLWSVQNEETARSVLKPNIYPSEILTNARNYLRNCSPNAILISNGDNDTYPLWYVQVMEHFRTDVTVVNTSLLYRAAYVKSLKLGMNGVVINFSLSQQLYDSSEVFYFDESGSEVGVDEALNWLQSQEGIYSLQMPFSGFIISCPYKPDSSIRHRVTKYIFKNKIAILDMLYSNSRPLEFTQDWDESTLFSERLVMKGIIYRLDFCDNQKIDHNAFFDFLQQLETNTYTSLDNFPKKDHSDEYIDIVFIKNLYRNLLIAMMDAKDIKDIERFEYYVVMYKNFLNTWAVKPSTETLERFENVIR